MERSRKYEMHGPVIARIAVHADGASFVTIESQLRDVNLEELFKEAVARRSEARPRKMPTTSPTAVHV